MQTLEVKLDTIPEKDFIVRTGAAAAAEREAVKIEIEGDINSISNFLKKRNEGYLHQAVDKNKVVVTVNKDEWWISMELDPNNHFGTVITGTLEISKELEVFGINKNVKFTREALVQLVKMNRLSFDKLDQQDIILKSVMSFSAKAFTELKQESDFRGNKDIAMKKTVETGILSDFTLSIPVFKGQDTETFRVEICLDVTDGGARFWFESVELNDLIRTKIDIIFNEQLKACEEFVIINQ